MTVAPAPVEVYAHGLAGGAVIVEYDDGSISALPVARWRERLLPGDAALLARVHGPALDVGCGPGRLTVALAARGVPTLGIDVCREAVRMTRSAGGAAVHRDVFAAVPGAGRWPTVLLIDGNVGIGGSPVALLRRVSQLLGPGGSALVETAPPAAATRCRRARLHAAGRTSGWFGWAQVGAGDVAALGARAGLRRTDAWTESDRWFAVLTRP